MACIQAARSSALEQRSGYTVPSAARSSKGKAYATFLLPLPLPLLPTPCGVSRCTALVSTRHASDSSAGVSDDMVLPARGMLPAGAPWLDGLKEKRAPPLKEKRAADDDAENQDSWRWFGPEQRNLAAMEQIKQRAKQRQKEAELRLKEASAPSLHVLGESSHRVLSGDAKSRIESAAAPPPEGWLSSLSQLSHRASQWTQRAMDGLQRLLALPRAPQERELAA